MNRMRTIDPARLQYDQNGLLPVVVQDVVSGAVLFLTNADRDAIHRTLATGKVSCGPRSRQQKGGPNEDPSPLEIVEVIPERDGEALLIRAVAAPGSDAQSIHGCFVHQGSQIELGWLSSLLERRREADPRASYTARLMKDGVERIAQKVGEEATETVIAAVRGRGPEDSERHAEVVTESADLLYHVLMLWLACGVAPKEVGGELAKRRHSSSWEKDD